MSGLSGEGYVLKRETYLIKKKCNAVLKLLVHEQQEGASLVLIRFMNDQVAPGGAHVSAAPGTAIKSFCYFARVSYLSYFFLHQNEIEEYCIFIYKFKIKEVLACMNLYCEFISQSMQFSFNKTLFI